MAQTPAATPSVQGPDPWGRQPGDPLYGKAPKVGQDTTSASPYNMQANTAAGINPSTGLPYGSTDQPSVGGTIPHVDPATGNPVPGEGAGPGTTPPVTTAPPPADSTTPPATTAPPATTTPDSSVPVPAGNSDSQVADYLRALMATGLAPQAAIDIANKNLNLQYGSSPAYYPGTNSIGLTDFYMDGASGWGNVNRGPSTPSTPAVLPVDKNAPATDPTVPPIDQQPNTTAAATTDTPSSSDALFNQMLAQATGSPATSATPGLGTQATGGITTPTGSGVTTPTPPDATSLSRSVPAMQAASATVAPSPNQDVPATTQATGAPPATTGTGSAPVGAPGTTNDTLFNQLMARAQQSLNVNPYDPVIQSQLTPYKAQQQQAARDALSAAAERAGPNANLSAESRLANEQVGQSTSGFEGQLMQNELTARRTEIQNALTSMQAYLTDEQKMQLQQQLDELDNALRYAQLGEQKDEFGKNLGQRAYEFDVNNQMNTQLA